MGSSRVAVKCPKCEHAFLPSLGETQSRAGRSSRQKGHNFERKVAKLLQKWWNREDQPFPSSTKYEFKRSPQSGGSVLKIGFQMHGDVVSNAPNWHWNIECKNAPGSFAGLHQFLSAEKFKMWDWLAQAENDCPPGKRTLLIVNRFDQPTWCISRISPFIENAIFRTGCGYFKYHHWTNTDELCIWTLDDMLASDPEIWV